MNENVRMNGLIKFTVGIVGAVLVGFVIQWMNKAGYQLTGWGMIVFGVPGAIGAAGLIECVSGIPFTELSQRWDDLEGWQRGLLGMLVVALCIGALIGGVALWGYLTM
jgi:hypothetical protein